MVSNSPFGIAGPKGMDPAVVKVLHDAFKKGMEEQSYKDAMAKLDQEDILPQHRRLSGLCDAADRRAEAACRRAGTEAAITHQRLTKWGNHEKIDLGCGCVAGARRERAGAAISHAAGDTDRAVAAGRLDRHRHARARDRDRETPRPVDRDREPARRGRHARPRQHGGERAAGRLHGGAVPDHAFSASRISRRPRGIPPRTSPTSSTSPATRSAWWCGRTRRGRRSTT